MASGTARAVFLDRDGTLIEDVGYLRRLEDLRWLPGAKEAVRIFARAGFRIVVVTNQSGIARGLVEEGFVKELHRLLARELEAQGARVDGWYYCPHHPEHACSCRKPEPGLLRRAALELGLDLRASYMIGDKASDMEAGLRAGATPLLVLTGEGKETLRGLEAEGVRVRAYPDLLEAARAICYGRGADESR